MGSQFVTIEQASTACLPKILAVLSATDLPHEGVKEHLSDFLIARNGGGRLIGCVGLERYGDLGLLRSAAVLPEHQGQGIGFKLIHRLLEITARDGVTEIVLLTTTAKDYFRTQFGFQEKARAEYQQRLADSPEWNLPRCSSAAFMSLKLNLTAGKRAAKRVLILCTGNSARSQMAEGILRHDGGSEFEVFSAGTRASFVRPEAIRVMAEIGIDISTQRSKSVDEFTGQKFDYVITVCDHANEVCPVFPGRIQRIHQSFEDPPAPGSADAETTLAVFCRVRDEIRQWMRGFIQQTG